MQKFLWLRSFISWGDYLGLDKLRDQASNLSIIEYWERLAVSRTIDDLYQQQRQLTEYVLQGGLDASSPDALLAAWLERYQNAASRTKAMILEMETGGALTVAKLSLAASQVRELSALVGSRLSINS